MCEPPTTSRRTCVDSGTSLGPRSRPTGSMTSMNRGSSQLKVRDQRVICAIAASAREPVLAMTTSGESSVEMCAARPRATTSSWRTGPVQRWR